jgi:hypothetical protein
MQPPRHLARTIVNSPLSIISFSALFALSAVQNSYFSRDFSVFLTLFVVHIRNW